MHKGKLTNVNPPRITTEPNRARFDSSRKRTKKQPSNINLFNGCFFVAGPAFEIYKLGTILLNRKSKKNKALYTNIQYITNTHLVNPI